MAEAVRWMDDSRRRDEVGSSATWTYLRTIKLHLEREEARPRRRASRPTSRT